MSAIQTNLSGPRTVHGGVNSVPITNCCDQGSNLCKMVCIFSKVYLQ